MNTIKRLEIIFVVVLFLFVNTVSFFKINEIPFDDTEKILYNNNIIKEEKINTVSEVSRSSDSRGNYTYSDLILLARLIDREAGSSWLTDEHQQLVGAVVLNRVKSEWFPNSIQDVVYQKGQYACINSSKWEQEPSQRALENAQKVLEGKVFCPDNIVFQAEFKQGSGVYKVFYNEYTNTNTYFCYK
jgi:spore germination cell wall hydrolase CwlJ-like protein